MVYRMKIIASNAGVFDHPLYLERVDYDEHNPDQPYPTGHVWLSEHPEDAMPFATMHDLLEAWRRPSNAVPYRPDGKPNRPLTAFTVIGELIT